MKIIFEPFKGKRVNSIDGAILEISDYINNETSLEIKEIYFSTSNEYRGLLCLMYKLVGIRNMDEEVLHVLMIDRITFKEAKKSWVDFFHLPPS